MNAKIFRIEYRRIHPCAIRRDSFVVPGDSRVANETVPPRYGGIGHNDHDCNNVTRTMGDFVRST